ncbi:MAG: tetratricopeptide repeat protein, partial [Sphaerospermopsis sp. SIO1G2]|nr:tetratricopeptide repeat protein [Sphaerospermopsis sp. SIO1G2]
EYNNKAFTLRKDVGNKRGEANTTRSKGLAYSDLGEKQKALQYYNQALPLRKAVGDRRGESTTLNNIGLVYSDLGDKKKALEYYNQVLPLRKRIGDKSGEATTLTNIGLAYSHLGDKQKALKYYNQALPIRRQVGDKNGEATTINNIAVVYDDLGEKQKALEYYDQALTLYKQVGNIRSQATTLNNIGLAYDDLGEKQKALEYYNQALPIRRKVGDRSGEANTLTSLGKVYDDLGEKQKALDYYNQALPLRRAVGDKRGEGTTLNNIAVVYSTLGDKQKALEYYNQSLKLRKAVGDKSGEANTLNNIGLLYDDLGEKQKALEYYNQALPLRRAVGDRSGEAGTLTSLGRVYFRLGQKQKALQLYNQALPLRTAVGDRRGKATTLNNIAVVYSSLGDPEKALAYYKQALPLTTAVGNKSGEANTLRNLAYLEDSKGNLDQALKYMQSAINLIENLRTKIINPELRTSYFATVQDYYKFYIDLLMKMHKKQPSKGYDALALQASESARARSLLELITEANTDIRTGVDPQLLQAEKNLKQKLDKIEKSRVELLSQQYTPEQRQNIEREIKTTLDKYQNIQSKIRSNSPRYAAITQPQPLTLKEIQQQVLDENTLLLEYSLGLDKSYLWAITKTGITSHELPKSETIEKLVKNFRNEILKPYANSKTVAKASIPLTKILLSPVAQQLENQKILVVGDGALQYLPFAALSLPNTKKEYKPLIVNHEIVTLPSASTAALIRTVQKGRKTAPKSLFMVADPVFTANDERLTKNKQPTPNTNNNSNIALQRAVQNSDIKNLKRLPFTRKEAETILNLVPDDQKSYVFDFAANRDFATSSQLNQYRILHFATHGIFDSKQPELSGLVLSLFDRQGKPNNGFLRLHDIFNLDLAADLVVLSACQTGLGENIKGEGIVGLTTGFIYAGTPRVVMSLWNVDDEGTSVLMEKFYQKMLKEGLNPTAALREAQLEMIADEDFSRAYFWAGFTLQGEWN